MITGPFLFNHEYVKCPYCKKGKWVSLRKIKTEVKWNKNTNGRRSILPRDMITFQWECPRCHKTSEQNKMIPPVMMA